MPKDEFDTDDPMELCGVGLFTEEDTTDAMAECFIDEFLRLGHNHKQILALFRNPFYIGVNMVLQNRGEQFVRERITEVFARWGKSIAWQSGPAIPLTSALSHEERDKRSPCVPQSEAAEPVPARDMMFPLPVGEGQGEGEQRDLQPDASESGQLIELDPAAADPMGGAIPKLDS